MSNASASPYHKQASGRKRRVRYTGTGAVPQGIGLAFVRDRGTAGLSDGSRDHYVEDLDTSNHHNFAGVTAHRIGAKASAGKAVDIWLPGSVCEVAASSNTTIDSTILHCMASLGGTGRFHAPVGGGIIGKGAAKALQTRADVVLDGDLAGAGAFDTTGLIMTDAGADFIVTSGVEVGDTLVVFSVENDGTDSGTAQEILITARDATTITVGSAVTTTGGTMEVFYAIIRGSPRVLAQLYEGDESSGCMEYLELISGAASQSMVGGSTHLMAGITIGSNSTSTLADGTRIGELKHYFMHGLVTTSAWVETVTNGILAGANTSLATMTFDAASDSALLKWCGTNWKSFTSEASIESA